jgi:hypothetical protein
MVVREIAPAQPALTPTPPEPAATPPALDAPALVAAAPAIARVAVLKAPPASRRARLTNADEAISRLTPEASTSSPNPDPPPPRTDAPIDVEAPASAPTVTAEPGATLDASALPEAPVAAVLPGAGEEPPPVYRTALPPAASLHYQVRRGFLRGEGEIRWQPRDGRYRLVLEARIAGVTLLLQTSEGALDATGLAPERFLDQRARRSAQAANFVRERGRITFSGSAAEWPLLPGSQDRLSWMIQLAAIAAAEPERLVDGGRISMEVAGARGDASVWTLRVAGREEIETAAGTVRAVKLVRDGRSAYDTTAEIWLDPERSYFPAHATLRNSGGASEYDLLLERIDP